MHRRRGVSLISSSSSSSSPAARRASASSLFLASVAIAASSAARAWLSDHPSANAPPSAAAPTDARSPREVASRIPRHGGDPSVCRRARTRQSPNAIDEMPSRRRVGTKRRARLTRGAQGPASTRRADEGGHGGELGGPRHLEPVGDVVRDVGEVSQRERRAAGRDGDRARPAAARRPTDRGRPAPPRAPIVRGHERLRRPRVDLHGEQVGEPLDDVARNAHCDLGAFAGVGALAWIRYATASNSAPGGQVGPPSWPQSTRRRGVGVGARRALASEARVERDPSRRARRRELQAAGGIKEGARARALTEKTEPSVIVAINSSGRS